MSKKQDYSRVRYSTFMKLESAVYDNAVRLILDACILYKAGSYPTSYALSILAFEELGKLEMLDHIGFEGELNGFDYKKHHFNRLFSRDLFFSHRAKQIWGAFGYSAPKLGKRLEARLSSGKLDIHKQDSLYVDYHRKKIKNPTRFTPNYAYQQIKATIQLLENIGDLAFYEVFEDSTEETRARAQVAVDAVTTAFGELNTPRELKAQARAAV